MESRSMNHESQDRTSRRDFVKTTAVAALGTTVLSNLAVQARAYATGDDTIRIGLIGCGGRGSGAAKQALTTAGNVKLVAIGDAFAEPIEEKINSLESAFAGQPGRVDVPPERRFVGFDAYQKVIDSGVDLVILATPPGFRPIHFEAAVNAGKHVFMEKPVAVDAPGVRKVLDVNKIAKEKNLKVGCGLQRHHQANYLETIRRIHEGGIGDIVALRVYWNGGGVWEPRRARNEVKSEMEYQMWNWYYYNWLSGDHIVEQHIHNLDVGNWIMQDYPVRCHGIGGRQVRKDKRYGEIFDHHAVEFEYANGTRMYSQCAHMKNCWGSVTEHAIGTKGTADLRDRDEHCFWTLGSNGSSTSGKAKPSKVWRYEEDNSADPYQVEHDDLFAAIREDKPYNEGDNGARSTLTSIMGRMATYSGKLIEWDEALASELSIMPSRFAWDADPPTLPNAEGEYPIPVPGFTKVL